MSAEISPSFIGMTAILSTIVVGTIVGNLFVIIAILVDKNLQTPANQLVLSLACSDLMVAGLVMPLGAYNDLNMGWYLGKEVCEFWTSADVLCCTASILNLLAIAMDRYWAVTNVDYIYRRTRARMNTMIVCAWTVGAIVSLAPIFGWKDPDFARRVLVEHKCLVSQDVAYQIFATISTFYAPLVLLLALYWRIFQVARKRIRRKPGQGASKALAAADKAAHPAACKQVSVHRSGSQSNQQQQQRQYHPSSANERRSRASLATATSCANQALPPPPPSTCPNGNNDSNAEQRRELAASQQQSRGGITRQLALCDPHDASCKRPDERDEVSARAADESCNGWLESARSRGAEVEHSANERGHCGGGREQRSQRAGREPSCERSIATGGRRQSGGDNDAADDQLQPLERLSSGALDLEQRPTSAACGDVPLAAAAAAKMNWHKNNEPSRPLELQRQGAETGGWRKHWRRLSGVIEATWPARRESSSQAALERTSGCSCGGQIERTAATGHEQADKTTTASREPRRDHDDQSVGERVYALECCCCCSCDTCHGDARPRWPKTRAATTAGKVWPEINHGIGRASDAYLAAAGPGGQDKRREFSAGLCETDIEAQAGRFCGDSDVEHKIDERQAVQVRKCSSSSGRRSRLASCDRAEDNDDDEDEEDDDDDASDASSLSGPFPLPLAVCREVPEADCDEPGSARSPEECKLDCEQGSAHDRLSGSRASYNGSSERSPTATSPNEEQEEQLAGTSRPDSASATARTMRSLSIKRKFRALGQLVSFVQTSRQFNSFSSSSAAQNSLSDPGDELEADYAHDHDRDAQRAAARDFRKPSGQAAGETGRQQHQQQASGMFSELDESFERAVDDDDDDDDNDTLSATRPPVPTRFNQVCCSDPAIDDNNNDDAGAPSAATAANDTRGLPNVTSSSYLERAANPAAATDATVRASTHRKSAANAQAAGATHTRRRENMDIKREKKAAKTLAIITGVFVVCWLPFFVMALAMPICGPSCTPSDLILSVVLWLGYLNSLLNPIIYTIFSPDFRRAFRRLLCWPELISGGGGGHRQSGKKLAACHVKR